MALPAPTTVAKRGERRDFFLHIPTTADLECRVGGRESLHCYEEEEDEEEVEAGGKRWGI